MYDIVDQRGVPVSRGVPQSVRIAFVIGVIAIFVMGYITIIQAGYGHKWPAATVLRVPLDGTGQQ